MLITRCSAVKSRTQFAGNFTGMGMDERGIWVSHFIKIFSSHNHLIVDAIIAHLFNDSDIDATDVIEIKPFEAPEDANDLFGELSNYVTTPSISIPASSYGKHSALPPLPPELFKPRRHLQRQTNTNPKIPNLPHNLSHLFIINLLNIIILLQSAWNTQ